MKTQSKSSLHLQQYIFKNQLIMIVILSLILGTVGIFVNLYEEALSRDKNLINVAETIAHSDTVKEAIDSGDTALLNEYLKTIEKTLTDIDVISVIGHNDTRLYHTNKDLIGTTFDGTKPDFIANGDYYSVNESGPSGMQRRTYAAIRDDKGNTTGFLMTIMLMQNIRAKRLRTIVIFAATIILAIIIEFLFSLRVGKKVRDALMGYEPDTFSTMYKIRDNILESLEEGIVAVNETKEIEYINKAALSMIDKTKVKALLTDTIETGKKEFSHPINTFDGTDILIDRIPVRNNNLTIGAIGILHNRTEYTRLAEDLAGTKYLVDSMRANNHDFTNKLHVILGLLQMENYDEAMHYIEDITMVEREIISEIMHKILSPSVAALLIGKTARAAELNVRFKFNKESFYDPAEFYIPDDVLITVIGNLIDNALDSMNEVTDVKELYVGIFSKEDALLITVDDTGCGISEDNLTHIFENGFSTKGDGRGTGLYQIKNLIEAYKGTISVESEEGTGTSFTVSFTK